jgi:ABC-type amino acid transport system permease subunit
LRGDNARTISSGVEVPDFLLFASDATLLGLIAGTLLLIAAVAAFAERRRVRRKAIDAVGCVPWLTVFFLAFFPGVILMVLAIKGWITG